ncbi:tetratricopeptide repeat protein [Candidatus Trichorickettsia mobilis]|uniref:tetratricopeptide repeat protein n=1 Tax=Candidatus Trichorickettsia mobilis TaxID=1346319 RepID=UPI00292FB674|nr:tetratricopeptide repeat protein [Candidatus Trichorickettsia mobilis]
MNLDRSEEALACLNVAISLLCDAHKAEIYYQTGLVLQSLDKYEESLVCFDQAINSKPNFLDAYKEKIHSLYTLIPIEKNQRNKENQLKETLVCLNKMTNLVSNSDKVKIDNEEVKALYVLGYTSYKLNKYEQAIDSYKKAIEINNDLQMAHYGLEIANEALSIALIGIDPEI